MDDDDDDDDVVQTGMSAHMAAICVGEHSVPVLVLSVFSRMQMASQLLVRSGVSWSHA